MSKLLVAYFSASGVTKKVAQKIANVAQADLVEIAPKERYTKADLNWMDKKSRSSVEMNDPASRPEIEKKLDDISAYDTVAIGFPIWWYTAPTIIKTFLEAYDFTGKKIALFATSGSSGFGDTVNDLKPCVSDSTEFISEKIMNRISDEEISEWVHSIM